MQFRPVQWFESLSSTNDYLRAAVEQGVRAPANGAVVAARAQTGGRGRESRRWRTTPGKDLAFSFLIARQIKPDAAPSVAMAAALGICDALESYGALVRVKWPNDVCTPDGRKLCGILAQAIPRSQDEHMILVVGVGLNVNSSDAELAEVQRPAASMRTETGQEYPIDEVLNTALDALARRLSAWERGGFPAFREDWLSRCDDIGRARTVSDVNGAVEAHIEDFGDQGELLLRGPDGQRRRAYLPEVAPS